MQLQGMARRRKRYKSLAAEAAGAVIERAGYCLLCGGDSILAWCEQCHRDMRVQCPCCAICALPVHHAELCGNCITTPPNYHACLTLYHYQYPSDRIISQYKYQHFAELAGCFAHYFYQEKLSTPHRRPDLLLPVPLHWRKQCWRGFNQSVLFAEKLASLLEIKCWTQGVSRMRATPPQTLLNITQRKTNIAKAFRLNGCYKGKCIALVDDVVTTGATVNEIGRLLKKQHVAHIQVWAIARAKIAH